MKPTSGPATVDHRREGRTPKSNTEYWAPKLQRNVQRDAEAQASLKAAGWESLVIWECETLDEGPLREQLEVFLRS